MSARVSERYTSGRALAAAGRIDEAVAAWRSAAADAARADGDGRISAWLLLQAATALRDANRMDDAHAAIREGLAFAERSRDRAAIAGLHEAEAQTYEMQRDFGRGRAIVSRSDRGPAGCGRRNRRRSKNAGRPRIRGDRSERLCRRRTDSAGGGRRFSRSSRQTVSCSRRVSPTSESSQRMRGDREAAEPLLRRAAALLERLVPDTPRLRQRAEQSWQTSRGERGDLAKAAELHERALAIHERLDPSGLDVATSLTNLGKVASDRGSLAEGRAVLSPRPVDLRAPSAWNRGRGDGAQQPGESPGRSRRSDLSRGVSPAFPRNQGTGLAE